MRTLSENQIKVLKLYRDGKEPSEICRITGLHKSSVDEAIKRGLGNIYRATEVLSLAIDNKLLDEDQVRKLRLLCSKV